jgi:hypothetical protein
MEGRDTMGIGSGTICSGGLGLVTISGIDDLNARCRHWLDNIANVRTHGTTGRIPLEMLKEEKLRAIAGRLPYSR